jgi:hypothetical protein
LLKTEETKQDVVAQEQKAAEVTAEEVVVATNATPEGGAEVATDGVAVVQPENTEEEKNLSEAAQETNPAPEAEDTATTETEAAAEAGEAEEEPEIKVLLWPFIYCDCFLFLISPCVHVGLHLLLKLELIRNQLSHFCLLKEVLTVILACLRYVFNIFMALPCRMVAS